MVCRPFIAANWKMNKTISEARDFVHSLLPSVKEVKDADIVIAPPFTSLHALSDMLKGANVRLAGQDVFHEDKGAFTGEISPAMLKDAGCEYVIIGHSERRNYFLESDAVVNKKAFAAIRNSLSVIFCIGESLSERETGRTYSVLEGQIENGLKGIDAHGLIVAYEPVWAIGTGRTASTEQAQEAHSRIREKLAGLYKSEADSIRILYGGSVTPENIDSLMACPDVDGALVGGASLKPESFANIIKFKRRNK